MEDFTALYKSPSGNLYIAVNSNKKICSIKWSNPKNNKLEYIEELHKKVFLQLDEYFNGKRNFFDLKIKLEGLSEFNKKILLTLFKLPYGKTISYQELAEKAGYPGASRAAGSAMRKNPVAVIIPCHRVLNKSCFKKDGLLPGSYSGGIDKKIFLLKLEGNKVIFKQESSNGKPPLFSNKL